METYQRAREGADLGTHCEVQRSSEEPLGSKSIIKVTFPKRFQRSGGVELGSRGMER